ncbi:hypothetical protein Bcav_0778 [Beutenbergia cavernae DSM 12333]|uniref:Uncharacterized protein n=1 Tax=Beutenbergia cavernae (strain ATCC BAA-8 / DSM 12333 / CCUG 43141 / JCM 11478 / NBRC 16432 / NCIMB 13614 / HKI 0122) TaxID=471853 RepID=C5BYT1_BEUC1|nr:hypothetical protein [Beutenbergia cavernae]ACQ79039.1 hypothetical protein Bcav_0778 [Beutenbergia cavernae DSM 12333]
MRHDQTGDDAGHEGVELARRGLILGAGATALAGVIAAVPGIALAAPREATAPDAGTTTDGPATPLASPITSTIASAPQNGYSYAVASMFDFTPESPTSQRAWGGVGVYTANAPGMLWASVDIPAGALVRDIEWYVRNTSGATVHALARLWAAGTGNLFATLRDIVIPTGSAITATRGSVPSAAYGPYPTATKLNLGLFTPVDGSVQVNGVRVGMTRGGSSTGLLASPVRIYDSRRSGGRFAAGSTRTLTVPVSVAASGVTGILANLTAIGGTGSGHLRVYPASSPLPPTAAVTYRGDGSASENAQPIGISTARQFKVYASAPVHLIVDVIGTLA